MEIKAIQKAIHIAIQLNIYNCTIFTDSKSTVRALGSVEHNKEDINIARTRQLIKTAREIRTELTLVWVPRRKGIAGNEMVDKLAKEAAIEPDNTEMNYGYNELNESITKKLILETREFLKGYAISKGTEYFLT